MLYNTNAKMELTNEAREALIKSFELFIDKYKYNYSDDGVGTIIDTWKKNKGWIEKLLENHPNYIKEKKMIVLDMKIERTKDSKEIDNFIRWAEDVVTLNDNDVVIKKGTALELGDYNLNDHNTGNNICNVWFRVGKDITYAEAKRYLDLYRDNFAVMQNAVGSGKIAPALFTRLQLRKILYRREISSKLANASTLIGRFHNAKQNLDEDIISNIMRYCPELKPHMGQKTSRVMNKLCHLYGIDKASDYNSRFAKYADAINPIEFKKKVIISINPLDFLGMSIGTSWASCMTLDIHNVRGMSNSYHGMYSGGIMSYLLDESSVIVYTLPDSYDGTDYELQPKEKRCMFFFGEDKILQNCVYTDGRDNGDGDGIQTQLRNIVQKVVSECCNVPNRWTIERGSTICGRVTDTDDESVHYRDYTQYNDGVVSFYNNGTGEKNYTRIRIGKAPICPVCGEDHCNEKNICCEDCAHTYKCESCGEYIDDEDDMIEYDGCYYCCPECAENAGIYYCENSGEYVSRDDGAEYDEYYERWFDSSYYETIHAEDGTWFEDSNSAEMQEYVELDNGEWWSQNDDYVYRSDYSYEWFRDPDCKHIIDENGDIYKDIEEAHEAGVYEIMDNLTGEITYSDETEDLFYDEDNDRYIKNYDDEDIDATIA